MEVQVLGVHRAEERVGRSSSNGYVIYVQSPASASFLIFVCLSHVMSSITPQSACNTYTVSGFNFN